MRRSSGSVPQNQALKTGGSLLITPRVNSSSGVETSNTAGGSAWKCIAEWLSFGIL
jgi:hypothetical protein